MNPFPWSSRASNDGALYPSGQRPPVDESPGTRHATVWPPMQCLPAAWVQPLGGPAPTTAATLVRDMKAPLSAGGCVLHPEKNRNNNTRSILHPKLLQGVCICTHPCNLGTHKARLTPFHRRLNTTTLARVINGVQRVCQILSHGEKPRGGGGDYN